MTKPFTYYLVKLVLKLYLPFVLIIFFQILECLKIRKMRMKKITIPITEKDMCSEFLRDCWRFSGGIKRDNFEMNRWGSILQVSSVLSLNFGILFIELLLKSGLANFFVGED